MKESDLTNATYKSINHLQVSESQTDLHRENGIVAAFLLNVFLELFSQAEQNSSLCCLIGISIFYTQPLPHI